MKAQRYVKFKHSFSIVFIFLIGVGTFDDSLFDSIREFRLKTRLRRKKSYSRDITV